jgi:hypothetical protein
MRKLLGLVPSLLVLIAATACVPQVFEQVDYRKHLTTAEKAALAAGQTVDKIHASYWVMHPQQLYWRGPLHIQPLPGGKLRFNPVGHWEQYDERGGLLCASDYTIFGANSAGYSRMYYPVGTLMVVAKSAPVVVAGDSVLLVRMVQFREGNEQDTAFVEHRWIKKDGTVLRPSTRSLDWAGKKSLPKKGAY